MSYTASFIAAFFYVGLRALQQLHVVNYQYTRVMPTSMLMAIGDMILITSVAQHGVSTIFIPIGIGSGLGAMAAMKLHQHRKKR